MFEKCSSIEAVNVYDSTSREIKPVDIGIKDGCISSIREAEGISSLYLVPGFVNTHSHVAMSRFRGMLDDVNLDEFLNRTFKLDKERSRNDIYHSSVVGIYEMLMNGITSFMDLYYSEDVIAEAVTKMGIRGFLSWVTLDQDKTTQNGNPLENAEEFIHNFSGSNEYDLVYPSIGVQGVYVASMENIRSASDISRKHECTLHMHLAETRKEVYDYMKVKNKRPARDLLDNNIIDERTNMAHCVWLTKEEIEKIGKVRGNVSWNSVSNHKLGVGGVPAIPELIEAGANIGIGTDSNGSNNSLNILETAKSGALAIKNSRWDASVIDSSQVYRMLTEGGGRSTGLPNLGSIAVGAPADFLIIDGDNYSMNQSRRGNFVNDLIYSMSPSAIRDIVIGGNFIRKDFRMDDTVEKEYKRSAGWIRENF